MTTETWSPKFFYVGCRYIQAHLVPATNGVAPKIKSVEGVVVQSSSGPVGEFECSNDLFNRIRKLVRWAQRSNMESILTDCPHRERLGWQEQDHLNGPALRYENSNPGAIVYQNTQRHRRFAADERFGADHRTGICAVPGQKRQRPSCGTQFVWRFTRSGAAVLFSRPWQQYASS